MNKMTTLLFVALFTVILGSSIYITFLKDSLNSLEVENEYIIKQNERLKNITKFWLRIGMLLIGNIGAESDGSDVNCYLAHCIDIGSAVLDVYRLEIDEVT